MPASSTTSKTAGSDERENLQNYLAVAWTWGFSRKEIYSHHYWLVTYWVEACHLRQQEAETTAKRFLFDFISCFDSLVEIHTYHGRELQSVQFKVSCKWPRWVFLKWTHILIEHSWRLSGFLQLPWTLSCAYRHLHLNSKFNKWW